MYKLDEFLAILEEFAPLEYSQKMIEKGAYDNSGIILKSHDKIEKVLFSLDLNLDVYNRAEELSCDTIVTHHPAIYNPISSLGNSSETLPILTCAKNGINVISMHLNLDVSKGGIDEELAKFLTANDVKIIDEIFEGVGYGREFNIKQIDIKDYAKKIEESFSSNKILFYGSGKVNTVASFCGSGGSDAVKYATNGGIADTIVTSDIPHHHLLSLINSGKKVIVIPHYVAENIGFIKFYEKIKERLNKDTLAYYFTDKRFI